MLLVAVDGRVVRRGAAGDRTGRLFVFGENVPYLGTTGPGRLWRRDSRRRGRGPVALHGFRCTPLELLQKVIDLDFYRVGRTGHVLPLLLFRSLLLQSTFLYSLCPTHDVHFLPQGLLRFFVCVLHLLLPLHRFLVRTPLRRAFFTVAYARSPPAFDCFPFPLLLLSSAAAALPKQ